MSYDIPGITDYLKPRLFRGFFMLDNREAYDNISDLVYPLSLLLTVCKPANALPSIVPSQISTKPSVMCKKIGIHKFSRLIPNNYINYIEYFIL